jgi:hypothetical protein
VDSDNFGWLLAMTLLAVTLSATVWLARPSLRRNGLLMFVFASSVTALFLEVAFVALFLSMLSGMPDMREF